jgi:hypothetical protein
VVTKALRLSLSRAHKVLIFERYPSLLGARSSVVVKVLRYYSDGPRIDTVTAALMTHLRVQEAIKNPPRMSIAYQRGVSICGVTFEIWLIWLQPKQGRRLDTTRGDFTQHKRRF